MNGRLTINKPQPLFYEQPRPGRNCPCCGNAPLPEMRRMPTTTFTSTAGGRLLYPSISTNTASNVPTYFPEAGTR